MKRALTPAQVDRLDAVVEVGNRQDLHEYIVTLHEEQEVTFSAIGRHFGASRQWAHKMYLKGKRNRANVMVDTPSDSQ